VTLPLRPGPISNGQRPGRFPAAFV
jgi:hypothetical protein